MKIMTICEARNEADILEACMRYYARWSQRIFITLHRCQDNSAEIIANLQREGLPIECSLDTELLHLQAGRMTGLLKKAIDEGADWIVPVDADEFITGDLPDVLGKQDGLAPVRVPWRCYVPMPEDSPSERNVLKRIRYRRTSEHPQWSKVIVPAVLLKSGEGRSLCGGNHALIEPSGKWLPHCDTSLTMAHFPVRSEQQIQRKVAAGWLTYFANAKQPHGNTFQWKAMYERMKNGSHLTSGELQQYALEYSTKTQWNSLPSSYRESGEAGWIPWDGDHKTAPPVFDPVPCDFDLRYPVREVEPLAVLLETAEAFARAYGECRFKIPQQA